MITHYCPNLGLGGINRLSLDIAYGLQQAGWQNTLLCPSLPQLNLVQLSGMKHDGIKGEGSLSRAEAEEELRQHLISNPCRILQVYKLEHISLVAQVVKSLKTSIRPQLGLSLSSYPQAPIPREIKQFHAVICSSKALRNTIRQEKRINPSLLHTVPYGVDTKQCSQDFSPSRDWWQSWLTEFPDFSNSFSLCIPCNISPSSGLEQVADILNAFKSKGISAQVYLTGDTKHAQAEYLAQLRKHYQNQAVASSINWLNERGDMREILCACNISLSLSQKPASHRQGLLDALALGRPVIAYTCGFAQELLEAYYPQGLIKCGQLNKLIQLLLVWQETPPAPPIPLRMPYRLRDSLASYSEIFNKMLKRSPLLFNN